MVVLSASVHDDNTNKKAAAMLSFLIVLNFMFRTGSKKNIGLS